MEIKMRGKLTISRPQGGDNYDNVKISIEDANSGVRFCEFRIPLSGFAEALLGMSQMEGDLILRGLESIGKKKECRVIYIDWPEKGIYDKEILRAYLRKKCASFEVEGWEADVSSALTVQQNGVRIKVPLVRWVEGKENG